MPAVEFLVEGELDNPAARVVFLELNPRIQVEHTITEQVTGVDLVQTQFLLAAGQRLADLELAQDNISLSKGFALQARISLSPTGGPIVTGYQVRP